ncbi:hypothetical protein RD00_23350 [Pseudomonas amygdali pv. tabaci]|nr:hypothetical protein RD00_23350 [Pseudomonas amygdali pv. tabaci]
MFAISQEENFSLGNPTQSKNGLVLILMIAFANLPHILSEVPTFFECINDVLKILDASCETINTRHH